MAEESARSSADGPVVVIEPIAPIEEAPVAIVEQVAKIEEPIVEEPREQKSLPEVPEAIVEEAPVIVEEPVEAVAPSSYRYYYRY